MFSEKLFRFRRTLSFRLTLWFAAIFTLSSFAAFSVFYSKIHSITMSRVDEELIEEAEEFAEVIQEGGIGRVKAEMHEEAEEEDESDIFLRVVSPDGETLTTTDTSSWGRLNITHKASDIKKGQSDHSLQTVAIPGREYKARVISTPIGQREIFQMGMILEDEEEYLEVFRNLFSILFLVMAVLSGCIGWFITRKGLYDVEEVTRTAMEISSGLSEKRVTPKHHYEEIDRLGNAFNVMLDRIQKVHKAMREINDNIAHDLRSPLARIRGIAEMTLTRERSKDDFKDMAADIMEECDALINMINTMLEITEAETGVGEQKSDEFDLTELVLDACEIFRPMAEDKQIAIKLNSPANTYFRGDRRKAQRIVTNLLENAIKYTPDRGTVTVSVRKDNGRIDLIVEDTGVGISQEELPRIFERFYRGEKTRSDSGIGLGLSLAKAFAVSLGGVITARSTLGKGSTFAVSFPN